MPLNVALAGLKGHLFVFTQGLAEMPEARLVAVADDDPAALEAARQWPCAGPDLHAYADWREMLDREPVDILGEAGGDSERHRVLVAAGQRGIPCLAEKPLACSLGELEEVRIAVDAAGVQLSMLLTMRFEAAYRVVREAILGGAIGEVCQASFQKSYRLGNRPAWQRSPQTFSGIIPFIGIHALDCIRWCTGREYVSVFGWSANVAHPEMGALEDQGQVLALLDNGGMASARLDYCRPTSAPTHGDDRMRVAGSRGVIETAPNGTGVTLITEEEGPRELPIPDLPEGQFANFVRAVQGRGACDVPAEDCFRATEVSLKARDSAAEGRPVATPWVARQVAPPG